MADLFAETVRALKTKIRDRSEVVARGALADYPEYMRECGHIAGLREALDHLQDLQNRYGLD